MSRQDLRKRLLPRLKTLYGPRASECLDKIILLNQAHLLSVHSEYVEFYNTCRLHQGIGQQTPIRLPEKREGLVQRRQVLGGIINDYYRMAV